MKDRIKQLMEAQHMNQQMFAQMTGISPASLSSIFNGRTEPTLRHVESIRKRFPNINLEWLLEGTGGMFVPASDSDEQSSSEANSASGSLISGTDNMAEGMLPFAPDDDLPGGLSVPASLSTNGSSSHGGKSGTKGYQSLAASHPSRQNTMAFQAQGSRRITEIRVFYDDQTWESFVPKK